MKCKNLFLPLVVMYNEMLEKEYMKECLRMEWQQEAKDLLEELLKPIPVFARPMAKKGIERSILGFAEGKEEVTTSEVVKGYIAASSGSMRTKAVKLLKVKGYDVSEYENAQ